MVRLFCVSFIFLFLVSSCGTNPDNGVGNQRPDPDPIKKPEIALDETFNELVKRSEQFHAKHKIPSRANRIASIAGNNLGIQENIVAQAASVRYVLHKDTLVLMRNFIAHKNLHGTLSEKNVYKNIDEKGLIKRLLEKRPLMFMTGNDFYVLRNGQTGNGGFETIGTNNERSPLILSDYISYDEMAISALLGVSVPTFFINQGDRNNNAIASKHDDFEKTGIYTGLVGARFERENLMEWQHMMVTLSQNTPQNGYGTTANPADPKTMLLRIWSQYYLGAGQKFKTFAEAKNDMTNRFIKITPSQYFDTLVYKQRLEKVLVPFLYDANSRAEAVNKKAFCVVVGLGLGVWQVSDEQKKLMIDVYNKILKENSFPHISDITFSWFIGHSSMGNIASGQLFTENNNNIKIHFNKNNPALRLTGEHEGKLLVAMYAWDGNAYPGNEYWQDMLSASGDPAAASCSTISELQNPEINPQFLTSGFVAGKI